ncbi:MAG: thioredoxin family protein [Burkholderiaceae bacterium]
MAALYAPGPSRAELDVMPGAVVVQFGTDRCDWCQAAEPLIANALADFPNVALIRIEDGRGRPTGRSFGVKLWPTMIFLVGGHEVARVTRPADARVISQALAEMTDSAQSDG